MNASDISKMQRLAEYIASHGMIVRSVTASGVMAASAGLTREGYQFSELSPLLATVKAARDWLGY